jgi:quinol monooxygenase YgiN
MTTVLCRFKVDDYDRFRPGYDRAVQMTPGLRSFRIWRAQDDPGLVFIEETFASRDEAQTAFTSAETQAAMAADGIDLASMWIDYFDEVGGGTR